jgi:isochorismate pyruvate lyase
MIEPDDCKTMLDVRAGVDELDEQIVTLLAARMRFMNAAARIKQDRREVRDEARKASVIAHAQSIARREGVEPQFVAKVYETLVEASIAYELERFDAR